MSKQQQCERASFLHICPSIYLVVDLLMVAILFWASLIDQLVKNLPAMQDIPVLSLGQEDLLEKG